MSDFSAVEVAISPVDKFREFLATKGQRLTQEREIIVEEVFSSHEHFDVDQLVSRLSNRENGRRVVSRSTVYRAINRLEEAGLIRKVARSEGREVFEHDYGYPQHDHLICQKCGTLIEFHNEQIARLIEEIAMQHEFRHTGHRLEVYGTCAECCRPPKRRHRKLDLL